MTNNYVIFRTSNKCWIYLYLRERRNIKKVIKLLQENVSMTTLELIEQSPANYIGVKNALGILLQARIINVRQFKQARIYRLNKGWEKRLEKHFIIVER